MWLFDTRGFPTIANYGQGWQTWLIVVFLLGKAFTFAGFVFFVIVFIKAAGHMVPGGINETSARVHLPRVLWSFSIASAFQALLPLVQLASFWWPALRFVGLFGLLASLALLGASLKTWWALQRCLPEKRDP